MNAITKAEFDLVDEASQFFAPVSSDLVDGLIGQYQSSRSKIAEVAAFISSPGTLGAMHYFLDGNNSDNRGRRTLEASADQLFREEGAVGALNSAYWSKALALTDVLDMMPQARRDEWHTSIREQTTPDFAEETVRSTLTSLLAMRTQFLAERVDGIFRGLSGEHVTNAPEAFGKRMIVAHVLTHYDTVEHKTSGLINDLRCVIAKFMGRAEPKYLDSSDLIHRLKGRWGEWVTVDGGALRIRLYKKGTAHMEVHPDMAYRLNQVLAHLHPMAIPAQFRQKPKRRPKDIAPMQRPLPFAVLNVLAGIKPARRFVKDSWPERYASVQNALMFSYTHDESSFAKVEALRVLQSIGGVEEGGFVQFEYDALDVVHEIVVSGCIPDKQSHQFYPTPEGLAQRLVEWAEIGPEHTCLEPSAGQGGIAQFLPADRTTCVELSPLNAKVLAAKGLQVAVADFVTYAELHWVNGPHFDRVAMNPPFSDGRARLHVEHAFSLLRPGGVLVAVLPSGFKGKAFLPGATEWSEVLEGQFPGTSVDVVLMKIRRPA